MRKEAGLTPTKVAREGREKYGWDMPTLKLARILYRDNPLVWRDVEAARACLRTIEGKYGKNCKTKVSRLMPERPRNPYNLPPTAAIDWSPHVVADVERILVFSDVHVPFHWPDAITAMLDRCGDVDLVIINGDLFDFHGISRFLKDPGHKRFAEEIQIGTDLIKRIQDETVAPVLFKLGNHDERYEHFLWQKAEEIADLEDFRLEQILARRVPEGLSIVKDKRIIQVGSLNIIHGHEFMRGFTSPVNIARGLYLKGKTSALQGHHHRTSEHTEVDMNGKVTKTWSTGCMCHLTPQYMPINSWDHGFATIDVTGDEYHVDTYVVSNGRVY